MINFVRNKNEILINYLIFFFFEEKGEDLHIAFNEIERSHGRVSEAAAQRPAGCTRGVKSRRVHLDLLFRRRNHKAGFFRRTTGWRRNGLRWSIQQSSFSIIHQGVQIEEPFGRRRVQKARHQWLARVVLIVRLSHFRNYIEIKGSFILALFVLYWPLRRKKKKKWKMRLFLNRERERERMKAERLWLEP